MKKFLFGILGLLFAVPAVATDLPAGYTELEYIESTGTQYIDTGIYSTDVIETMVVGQYTELSGSNSIFGVLESNGINYYGLGLADSGTKWRLWYGTGGRPWVVFGTPDTNKHTFLLKNKSIYIDNLDTPIAESDLSCSSQTKTMFLFGVNFGGNLYTPSKAKIFSAVIKDNNSLVRNLIPAKNSSGVVGMYDTVSGTFFTNAGTGEFIASPEVSIRIATTAYNTARFSPVVTELNDTIATIRDVVTNTINQTKAIADLQATKQTRPDETCPAGKKCLLVEDDAGQPHWYEIIENAYGLPSGYTGLEYVQSTGTQWIDTGIVPSADLMVEYTFQRVSSTSLAVWFGSSNGTGADYPTDTQFWTESNSWNIANCVPTGTTPSSANGHRCVINSLDTNKHTVTFNRISDGKVLWDGSVIGAYLPYETSNNKSMYLGISNHPGIGAYNRFTQKIYGARFTNKSTGNLVANFIPAKNSSGTVGMYDTVEGRFYGNAGTGTFIAGPEI